MKISGRSQIGGVEFEASSPEVRSFRAIDPRTGEELSSTFLVAGRGELEGALTAARRALPSLASPLLRADFLEQVADGLEGVADLVVARAGLETALPEPRLRAELGRTCAQLRLFAGVVREGSWVDARIDHGDQARTPAPRPDVRSMLVPVGPVAVFGASNFPLAFSTLGGDTASAWAAGNPVVVKGHPAHPGTAELCARVAVAAAHQVGVDPGVLSLLVDDGHEVGGALVTHAEIAAVGFTGSHRGGMALVRMAAARAVPIPVFAEMGSVNPTVLLDGALAQRGAVIAAGLFASCCLGVGQFCTNPGLVLVPNSEDGDDFVSDLARLFESAAGGTMLTPSLAVAYDEGCERLRGLGAQLVAEGLEQPTAGGARPRLWMVHGDTLRSRPALAEELFGPSALVVRFRDVEDLLGTLDRLAGQLTGTLHFEADLDGAAQRVATALLARAGRVVVNGFPTGVEVGHAMVHGGPYPATTDPRTTSVGSRAITRFARLAAWQDAPASWLPPELRDGNPRQIWRLVNGERTRA